MVECRQILFSSIDQSFTSMVLTSETLELLLWPSIVGLKIVMNITKHHNSQDIGMLCYRKENSFFLIHVRLTGITFSSICSHLKINVF